MSAILNTVLKGEKTLSKYIEKFGKENIENLMSNKF